MNQHKDPTMSETSTTVSSPSPSILNSPAYNEKPKDTTVPLPSDSVSTLTPPTSTNEQTDVPPEWKPSPRLYFAFLALCVLTLMVALDGTSLSVAIPIISRALHGSALEAFWAGTGFLLSSTVLQPNFASFSHIFGRVPVIMVAVSLFLIGTLVAGFANGFGQLLGGRVVQGIGGGGVIALTEVVITDLVPLRWRGQWAGIIGGMWALGSVTGPVIGGAFAEKVTWRWLFWLNLPFIGIGYVLIPWFLRLNIIPGNLATKLRRVDWTGSVLFVASTTSLLIPMTWGGVMYEWSSWHTLVPLILGIAGLIGFGFYEVYVAEEPVIRLSVFANQTVNIAYINTVLHGLILWCTLYYMPLYFEGVKGLSPIMTGVALFPATFTVAPMSIITGLLITYYARYRWSIWLGWTITVIGLGLRVLLEVDTSTVAWIFITLISGVGMGMLFPALQFQVQAATTRKDIAFAVAMFSFFRAFGQTLGVAVGGVIFQNQITKNLLAYPQFASQASELAKDAAALVELINNTTNQGDKLALKIAYTQSIRTIWIVMIAISAVGWLLSFWAKEYDLSSTLDTEQGLINGTKEKDIVAEEGA